MKVLVKIMAVALALFILQPCAEAQNKQLDKAHKKEAKVKIAEYQKEGWKIFGTAHTMEVAVLEHYENLKKEGVMEYSATVKTTNKSVGQAKLLTYVCNEYAQKMSSALKGKIVSELSSMTGFPQDDMDKFYAAYEAFTAREIQGEMIQSYIVYRTLKEKEDGKEVYELQGLYTVDYERACLARKRAFQNSIEESGMSQEWATKVSKFIEDGFKTDFYNN